jgi:hypothetical protein
MICANVSIMRHNKSNAGQGYINHIQILDPHGKVKSSIMLSKNGEMGVFRKLCQFHLRIYNFFF